MTASLLLAALLAAAELRSRRQMVRLGARPQSWRRVLPDLAAVAALALLLWPRPAALPATVAAGAPALALAVDVSASMAATDVLPDRLGRARAELRTLVEGLPQGRFALLPFAGEATLQVPLTADREALLFFVDRLAPGAVTAPGSAPEEAVQAALRALDGVAGERAVLLLSDGERTLPGTAPPIASGIPVHVITLGTEAGTQLPDERGTPRLDTSGRPILTRAEGERLRRIAATTGGEFLPAADGAPAVAPLLARWQSAPTAGERPSFTFPLVLALLLLLARHLPSRRRPSAALALLPLLLFCACGSGDERQGRTLFADAEHQAAAGDTTEAARLFGEASRHLEGEARAAGLHNRGTLLLAGGDPANAIPPLEEALLLLPGDEAIRRNLVLALRAAGDRRPPGIGEGEGGPAEVPEDGMSRQEALQLLESVRPDPGAPTAGRARVTETPVSRDW